MVEPHEVGTRRITGTRAKKALDQDCIMTWYNYRVISGKWELSTTREVDLNVYIYIDHKISINSSFRAVLTVAG